MARRLIIRPEAEADILEAAIWYEERESGLGVELISEVRETFARALENPLAYLLVHERPEVHRILMRRFPYRVFYILRADAVINFAVLHAAQHERHWKRRL